MKIERNVLKVAGLFAGIGGLEYGLHKAGHRTVFLCENDPGAIKVLEHRFPGVKILNDISYLSAKDLSGVDLVSAGFPCQDLSSVGPKGGIAGLRSSLVVRLLDVLTESPVEWVLLENVKFMLHLDRGQAMESILTRLERIGYRWAYRVLDTQAFGLPQRRHRVYILASIHHDPRSVILQPSVTTKPKSEFTLDRPIGFYWTEGRYATGLAADGMPPLKTGSTIGIPSPPGILLPNGDVVKPAIRDAERLQGFPSDWTIAAERVAKQVARWRLVGNAVSTPIPRWIGHRIADYSRLSPYTPNGDQKLSLSSWPDAAWGSQGNRYRASCSDWPLARRSSLQDFLKYAPTPLSKRAVVGFLSRARYGGLRYPEGFLEALEKYILRDTGGLNERSSEGTECCP